MVGLIAGEMANDKIVYARLSDGQSWNRGAGSREALQVAIEFFHPRLGFTDKCKIFAATLLGWTEARGGK